MVLPAAVVSPVHTAVRSVVEVVVVIVSARLGLGIGGKPGA
jgi:hypothetical protein